MSGPTNLVLLRPSAVPEAAVRCASPPVAVTRLALSDFRCYASLTLELEPLPVVLTGPNGAGKTNLLEAVSFLSPGRGLRHASLSSVERRAGPAPVDRAPRAWAVAARLERPQGEVEIGTGRDPLAAAEGARSRRLVKIDGEFARGQTALAEMLGVTWLTPQMDRLFLDGAAERRRFLDRLVYGFDPAHAGRVSAYERALKERGRLLRGEMPQAEAAWLDALERQIAEHGVAVAAARRDAVGRLAGAIDQGSGPFPRARVAIDGAVESWLDRRPALAVEDELRERLAEARPRDAAAGTAQWGPHRSDLVVSHFAKGVAAAECSTGEQKALLIALVLAHARLQAAVRGAPPLLLLDEVAAHLDRARREALFEEIVGLGAQAWLTGTDEALFAPIARHAQCLRVRDATVARRPDMSGSA